MLAQLNNVVCHRDINSYTWIYGRFRVRLLCCSRGISILSATFGVTGKLCKFYALCLMRNYKSFPNVLLTQCVAERKKLTEEAKRLPLKHVSSSSVITTPALPGRRSLRLSQTVFSCVLVRIMILFRFVCERQKSSH